MNLTLTLPDALLTHGERCSKRQARVETWGSGQRPWSSELRLYWLQGPRYWECWGQGHCWS